MQPPSTATRASGVEKRVCRMTELPKRAHRGAGGLPLTAGAVHLLTCGAASRTACSAPPSPPHPDEHHLSQPPFSLSRQFSPCLIPPCCFSRQKFDGGMNRTAYSATHLQRRKPACVYGGVLRVRCAPRSSRRRRLLLRRRCARRRRRRRRVHDRLHHPGPSVLFPDSVIGKRAQGQRFFLRGIGQYSACR